MGIGDWGLGIGPIPNPQQDIKFQFLDKIKIIPHLNLLENFL